LSQINPGIVHETDTNNHVMLYGSRNHSRLIEGQRGGFALFKMSKCTNRDIKDAACLHLVLILKHPTSPTPKLAQTTMVNAWKNNFSPVPAGRYSKS
jgi:hypothetical protein